MKKVLIYLVGFFITFFVLPVIFTITPHQESIQETGTTNISNENTEIKNESTDAKEYDYQKYKTIRLVHPETGQARCQQVMKMKH